MSLDILYGDMGIIRQSSPRPSKVMKGEIVCREIKRYVNSLEKFPDPRISQGLKTMLR